MVAFSSTIPRWSSRNRPCWSIIWMKSWNLVKNNGSNSDVFPQRKGDIYDVILKATNNRWCPSDKYEDLQLQKYIFKHTEKDPSPNILDLNGSQRHPKTSSVQETQIHQMHQIRHDPIVRWPDPPEGFVSKVHCWGWMFGDNMMYRWQIKIYVLIITFVYVPYRYASGFFTYHLGLTLDIPPSYGWIYKHFKHQQEVCHANHYIIWFPSIIAAWEKWHENKVILGLSNSIRRPESKETHGNLAFDLGIIQKSILFGNVSVLATKMDNSLV